jgi:hypothetical protein
MFRDREIHLHLLIISGSTVAPSVLTRPASVAQEAEAEVSEVDAEAVVCLSISCNFELC